MSPAISGIKKLRYFHVTLAKQSACGKGHLDARAYMSVQLSQTQKSGVAVWPSCLFILIVINFFYYFFFYFINHRQAMAYPMAQAMAYPTFSPYPTSHELLRQIFGKMFDSSFRYGVSSFRIRLTLHGVLLFPAYMKQMII